MMKFDTKTLIIGALLVIALVLVFFQGRRVSFADETSAPQAASPAPVNVSPDLVASLPSGALLPKTADEACRTKYGDNWLDFSLTMCKKL